MGHERREMSQVSGEAEGRPPGKGPWLCTAKNSRVTQSEREVGLFRELHIPQTECGPSQKAREQPWEKHAVDTVWATTRGKK